MPGVQELVVEVATTTQVEDIEEEVGVILLAIMEDFQSVLIVDLNSTGLDHVHMDKQKTRFTLVTKKLVMIVMIKMKK